MNMRVIQDMRLKVNGKTREGTLGCQSRLFRIGAAKAALPKVL